MEINEQDLKNKIDHLNQLAWEQRIYDSPGSFKLSGECLELLKGVDYAKGKAEAFRGYGFALVRLSKNEEALPYLNEAYSIFESLKDIKGLSVINEYLGIIQRNWGNFEASLQLLNKALILGQQTGFSEIEATILYQIGVTYKDLGNYEQALDHYHKCLHICRLTGFSLMEAYAINVIGAIYFEIEDYMKALHYYQQGLTIRQMSGDKWGEAGSLDNIGAVYVQLKDWKRAIDFCEKSFSICERTDDKRGQANVLHHLAEIYKQNDDLKKSDFFSNKSLEIRRSMGDRKGEAELLLFLSGVKQTRHLPEDDIQKELQKALLISNEINASDLSGKIHWALYESFRRLENYMQALHHLEIFNSIEKQLHKDAINQKVLNFDISLRAEKSENEATRFKIQNENLAALNTEIKIQKEETEHALRKLKETQAQLIQSEKMASLGELTAGIAHEIQNPLNFVNNFSEVNKELVDELQQELRAGKIDDAIVISNDIKENEEKINHHGKRAGDIVKGMLQHSRSSSGVKEPANINALADEYFRLAYHGLRAKDKSFNVSMKTEFDETIGSINIIPQDIGRVLLNVFNNAFYAVCPPTPQGGIKNPEKGYEPTVWVSTRRVSDKVFITVKDNGPGIPQKVIDKIFQPFFTTKPTGQGTGLGLSLAYDIVKVHGGEMKLETKEGEGSEFIIELPAA